MSSYDPEIEIVINIVDMRSDMKATHIVKMINREIKQEDMDTLVQLEKTLNKICHPYTKWEISFQLARS